MVFFVNKPYCCVQACQLAVITTPRDSYALCLLGLAQLAQYDSNPKSPRSQVVLADACLSFQASIDLEDKPQKGEPPQQLSSKYPFIVPTDVFLCIHGVC